MICANSCKSVARYHQIRCAIKTGNVAGQGLEPKLQKVLVTYMNRESGSFPNLLI
jgi:hypothetical protein